MNRFDLEQAITQCFQTSEDIDLLCEKILNSGVSPDEIADTLLGIKKLNDLRCEKAFYIMEDMIANGQMR
jgi:hypothetical protein